MGSQLGHRAGAGHDTLAGRLLPISGVGARVPTEEMWRAHHLHAIPLQSLWAMVECATQRMSLQRMIEVRLWQGASAGVGVLGEKTFSRMRRSSSSWLPTAQSG